MVEQGSSSALETWAARGVQFGVLLGLYRLLVGTGEAAEWVVGAGSAALATAGTCSVAVHLPSWQISVRGIGKVFGLGPRIVAESVRVCVSSLAGTIPHGSFAVVPINPGGDDAASVGRRGLVVAGGSLAPNSVVVTLDREHGNLLVHRLLPAASSVSHLDQDWPL